jgi:hypothetical protein
MGRLLRRLAPYVPDPIQVLRAPVPGLRLRPGGDGAVLAMRRDGGAVTLTAT